MAKCLKVVMLSSEDCFCKKFTPRREERKGAGREREQMSPKQRADDLNYGGQIHGSGRFKGRRVEGGASGLMEKKGQSNNEKNQGRVVFAMMQDLRFDLRGKTRRKAEDGILIRKTPRGMNC